MTEFITTNLNYFAYAMMVIGAILIILALFFMLKGRRRRK
ncbi:LPXTG cell wall anchor domain-containing protein [Weissella muntiaci]|uniref:LPXTG cell wall anchor domain-containing protein n=1 Tax=Weissella muntiaci TaxID=2508881 RepID=A0A6C2CAL8_9LACO|nr:LPXTG cell wall anchor domain-containing protein [Weissella muntiaci]TYC51037.1 LPXTG cell wall anchor domain-containing protein [Weissella muntiaci]